MHRVVWPLRYGAPPALAKGNAFADGVWAAPGRYTVELAVDGQRMARPLVVEPDPRVPLAPEAYRRQFDLARRVESARAGTASAMAEAEALHKALAARAGAPAKKAAESVSRAIAELDAGILAVAELEEGSPRAVPPRPRSLSSLRFLEGALETMASAVDGADADPSPALEAALARLESALAGALASWKALKTERLADVNHRLAEAGESPVVPKPER
jgi:hypothetical protein